MAREPDNKYVDFSCYPCHYYCYTTQSCDFYLMTKEHRGCPAGEGCVRFKQRGKKGKFGYDTSFNFTPAASLIMRQLYDKGMTDVQIAKQMDVPTYWVVSWRQWNRLPSQSLIRKEAESDWI